MAGQRPAGWRFSDAEAAARRGHREDRARGCRRQGIVWEAVLSDPRAVKSTPPLLAGAHSRERARVRESAPVAPTALLVDLKAMRNGARPKVFRATGGARQAAHAHLGLATIRSERPA
jgi:hypothetical protein